MGKLTGSRKWAGFTNPLQSRVQGDDDSNERHSGTYQSPKVWINIQRVLSQEQLYSAIGDCPRKFVHGNVSLATHVVYRDISVYRHFVRVEKTLTYVIPRPYDSSISLFAAS
jgi:hypothetical protein